MANHTVTVKGRPPHNEPRLGQLWINQHGVVFILIARIVGPRSDFVNAAVRLDSPGLDHNGWHLNIDDAVKGLTFLTDSAKITVEV